MLSKKSKKSNKFTLIVSNNKLSQVRLMLHFCFKFGYYINRKVLKYSKLNCLKLY